MGILQNSSRKTQIVFPTDTSFIPDENTKLDDQVRPCKNANQIKCKIETFQLREAHNLVTETTSLHCKEQYSLEKHENRTPDVLG